MGQPLLAAVVHRGPHIGAVHFGAGLVEMDFDYVVML